MRVLAIYRHYWPDTTPYARILHTLLAHWAASGHETVAFTAQPAYNDIRQPRQPGRQSRAGVAIRRIALLPERKRWPIVRAVNFAWFLLRAVFHSLWSALRGRRYDVVIANSHPPVLMGCALRLIRALTGTPYIYHCQDIHPESAVLAGKLRRGRLSRLLERLDAAACRDALRVVVLSTDMAESLAARGVSTANVTIINNPPLAADDGTTTQLPAPLDESTSSVRLLFAGNLGHFQGLDALIAAAHTAAARQTAFQLVFLGEGAAKEQLMRKAGELLGRQIVFLPHAPVETAVAAMRTCDYGIVSLTSDVYRYAYPSKSMTYLSAGCPLLAFVEPASQLACTIVDHELGIVAASRSRSDMAEAIATAVHDRSKWTPERREKLRGKCESLFGEAQMLTAWNRVLDCVASTAEVKRVPNRTAQSPAAAPAA